MSRQKATCIGLSAVLLWSAMIGLLRSVSEGLGPVGGAAVLYSSSALLLLFTIGLPRLRTFPRRYLYLGGFLFVVVELCYSLSIGYAQNARQTLEVGMVNYLWPSLTILFSVIFNHQKARWPLLPGMLLSLAGIVWVLSGDGGLDIAGMAANIRSNPFSYCVSFIGAVLWATYCTVTSRVAGGEKGITLFFMLTAAILWGKFLSGDYAPLQLNLSISCYVLMAAAAMAFGYAAWNTGIMHGNVSVLAAASYFIPVLSSAITATLFSVPLSLSFWQGVLLVCLGSLLSWAATRNKAARPPEGRARRPRRFRQAI